MPDAADFRQRFFAIFAFFDFAAEDANIIAVDGRCHAMRSRYAIDDISRHDAAIEPLLSSFFDAAAADAEGQAV